MEKLEVFKNYVSSGQAKEYRRIDTPFNKKYGRDLLNSKELLKILDVGCGDGSFVKYLSQTNDVVGIDISSEQINLAKSKGLKNVFCIDVKDYLININDCFDYIFFVDVLEHLKYDDLFEVLNASKKALKDNGSIIIRVPNGEGIIYGHILFGDITHERAYTCSSFNQISNLSGFSKCNVYEEQPYVYSFSSLIRRLFWIILSFPFRIIHFAERGTLKVYLTQNIVIQLFK